MKTRKERDAIVVDLFLGMTAVDNSDEAELVLRDLMSEQEIRNMARRLRIAVMLVCGCSYAEINRSIGSAPATIASVNRWLDCRGDGYRLIIERLGDAAEIKRIVRSSLGDGRAEYRQRNTKSRHGKYAEWFWPAEVIQAVVHGLKSGADKNGESLAPTSALRSAEVRGEEVNDN
jgi:TrpR-related protein YerC/YecD